jgi:PAS domain S-box-containing protein
MMKSTLKSSIAWRYFLLIGVLLIFGQLAFVFFIVVSSFNEQRFELENKVQTQADFLSAVSPDYILANNFYPLEALIRQISDQDDIVYAIVISQDGRLLSNYLNVQNPFIQDAIGNSAASSNLARIQYLVDNQKISQISSSIIANDLLIGEVRVGFTNQNLMFRLYQNLVNVFLGSAVLSIFIGYATFYLFKRQVQEPLIELGDLTNAIAQGNYEQRSPVQWPDEIGHLQQAFNSMADRLQNNLTELKKLSQVASQTKNMVIVADPLGRIEWVNRAFIETTGYTLAEAQGHTPGKLLQGKDSDPKIVNFMREQLRSGQGFTTEIINYSKSGEAYWVAIEVQPVFDDSGNLINFIGIETHINERKLSEKRIRDSEAFKTGILETAADAIISTNTLGIIIEYNPAAERIFGYTRSQAIGQKLVDLLIPSQYRLTYEKALEAQITTASLPEHLREAYYLGISQFALRDERPNPNGFELIALRSDGSEFPIEVAVTSLKQNDALIFTSYIRDITERKTAETQLRKYAQDMEIINLDLFTKQSRLSALLAIVADNLDIEQQIQRVVESGTWAFKMQVGIFARLTRETLKLETIYSPVISFSLPLAVDFSNTIIRQTLNASSIVSYRSAETNIPSCFESYPVYAFLGIKIERMGKPYGILAFMSDDIMMEDISESDLDFLNLISRWLSVSLERNEARKELQDYARELERSNRELQDFAYISSHDLQEPLRKIQAFGSRIENRYKNVLDERGVDYLQSVQNAANRMQLLIEDLLSFSRISSKAKPFASCDLNKVLTGVLSDLEIRIEECHAQFEIAALDTITADEIQMRQLFQNLIGNALKFRHPERVPLIKIAGTSVEQEDETYYEIRISDNGIGFEQKYSDRIFGIFQRLHSKEEYQGSGVGLAICRRIVERHRGAIVADGSLNVGAIFTVKLPVNQELDA